MRRYAVNEIFYSLQGEGVRAGTPNVFVRLSGCNMRCRVEEAKDSPGGFDCDTEFVSSTSMTSEEIASRVLELWTEGGLAPAVIFTGGEPLLQLDKELVDAVRARDCYVAVETNGSLPLPGDVTVDWVSCSPKVAEHAVRLERADEVRYVRGAGQGIPKPSIRSPNKIISPAFDGARLDYEALDWCIDLVKRNPGWRLSVQQHKLWAVR